MCFVIITCCFSLQCPYRRGFRVGQKLEATDEKNPDYTCVSTVAAIKSALLRVHFDGWEKKWDFWCSVDSRFIHPVGWCQRNGFALSPPQGKSVTMSFLKRVTSYTDNLIPIILYRLERYRRVHVGEVPQQN